MKQFLIALSLFAANFAVRAGNIYPWRIISGTATGQVDELQFSASDITLSITNIPGAGARGVIGIIGGGGGGSFSNTFLIAGNGIQLIDDGGGTNTIAIDPSIVVTDGTPLSVFGGILPITALPFGMATNFTASGGTWSYDLTNLVWNFTPPAAASGGVTNYLDSAGGPFSLIGHTNQPTLLIKGLTNQNPSVVTITDFGTMLGISVSIPGFGATNVWTTNGLPWATSDTFGFSNASSVVGLQFTNIGGVPTIYLQPDATIARTGQSQTWSAPQNFNSSATLTLGAPMWTKSSMTISDNLVVVTNVTAGGSLTVGGNTTITGNISAGSFTGSVDGGNITGNQTVGTNTLAVFGSNTGTIGSAGQFLVVHLNSAGIPDGWSTVTGSSLATSTNSISAVQLNGSWNNGVVGWIATNFSAATINGTTVTVGFASAPFETINSLHGPSLTLSNLLTPFGLTLTNNGATRIDLGGTVTMLSNSAGAFLQVAGSSSTPTVTVANAASSIIPIVTTPNATGYKYAFNAAANGVNPNAELVIQDGANQSYLLFTRDGPKAGEMFISFQDSSSGDVSIGQEPSGNATGDKRCVNLSTTTSVGGLIIVNQDNNASGLSGYQFYENDPEFPRILFTNNKQSINSNTPSAHETYASYGNWTNSGGTAALNGGALVVIGSNENWLVACGRASGSVSGTKSKEYPTNSLSGFLAAGLTSTQSNQTFVVLRDQTNGVWCIGVDTNGNLSAYRTNDLSTTVVTY